MLSIYIAALIFGGIFLVPMMLGALEFDGDVDFDFDSDADFDFDVEGGATGATDATGALGDFVGSLLSFRSVVFFGAFFGLTGVLFDTVFSQAAAVTLILALGFGLVAAASQATILGLVQSNMTDSSVSEHELPGTRATVVLPLGEDRKGRIRALVGGQTTYMVALPHRTTNRFDVGESVVVVEIQDGTALVAPLPGLEAGER